MITLFFLLRVLLQSAYVFGLIAVFIALYYTCFILRK